MKEFEKGKLKSVPISDDNVEVTNKDSNIHGSHILAQVQEVVTQSGKRDWAVDSIARDPKMMTIIGLICVVVGLLVCLVCSLMWNESKAVKE